ncbi:MAG: hypothetical protein KGJ06_07190 [Pseudomonadota bacterium]|nr:hypothetical protein [Pseudomonadota bacterium]
MNKTLSARLINATIFVVVLSLSLVAAEMGFRYYKYKIAPDPTAGIVVNDFEREPNARGTGYHFGDDMALQFKASVRYNNWAFRDDKDYSVDKRPGEFRIAVLGGSYTEATNSDQSWVQVLDQAVQHDSGLKKALHASRITIANFGNSGANIIYMARQLKMISSLYKPDLVIFAIVDVNFLSDEGWREWFPEVKAYDSVEEEIRKMISYNVGYVPIDGAPHFKIQPFPGGVNRLLVYEGRDSDFVNDKALLRVLHESQVKYRVYSGKIWLWEEGKKVWQRWMTQLHRFLGDADQKTGTVDPEQEKRQKENNFAAAEAAIQATHEIAPAMLFIDIPASDEVVDQTAKTRPPVAFNYWPEFFQKHRDVPLINLLDHLPKASYEEKYSWYLLPYDGHLSNKGVTVVGDTVAGLLSRYLQGDHSMLVTDADIAREIHRRDMQQEQAARERQALALLVKARGLQKKHLDEAIDTISQAIAVSDSVGSPGTVYQERANMWLLKGRYDKAYDDLTTAIAKSDNPAFLESRIQAALYLGKKDIAVQDVKKLQAISDKDAGIRAFLASLHIDQ